MKRIPRSHEVGQALAAAMREVKLSLRELNQEAAGLVAKGRYDAATGLVEAGRHISAFLGRLSLLKGDWKSLRASREQTAGEAAPLWQFFHPVAKTLLDLGGRAKRRDIEDAVKSLLDGQFQPGDLGAMAGGVPRWMVMVRRCRKAMIKEGFLEEGTGHSWRLSAAGRKLGQKELGEWPSGNRNSANL